MDGKGGCCHNGCELFCFVQQGREFIFREDFALDEVFKPKDTFIGFLLADFAGGACDGGND